jgi:hypothetical protein
MQKVFNKMEKMSHKSIEKWIYKNMHTDEELAKEFNDMVANVDLRKEDAKASGDTYLIDELEEGYEWGLRLFFLKFNGVDEDEAVEYAEGCYC